ncbi:MAG TPA: aspartate aminotransferase family protein [Thermodesulforhabdus norvegica]|uniref:Aspartate aminotransferase family protein n=1 Tax=Thermodesulforhabdus norvegica TaxID=39841 RepID=A0A7C1AZA9_9BACT|nr:aspartate aminotransferase family protein [Deltaproteobacteria bacterium]MBW2069163.1 aspartate aminotransferase family protein [Deltaproteobacteria bacterium]HDL90688.1 aspartate aminotransferase family protein [Thermodesulforhabdus norvegica]
MQWPNDYVFYRVPKRHYPVVDRGEGIYIWDDTGKRYIDGSGGAAVVTIGHGVGEIMEAMVRQARRIAYTHGTHFTSEAAKECAERLCRLVPDQRLNRVYFLSGGSEAVEAAVKVARQYWEEIGERDRYKIISRWGSFHGNTAGALALGGNTGKRRFYHPILMHTPHIMPCYCYRCPFKKKPELCDLECADQLERTIKYEGPETIAAFIAEPVVGATAGAVIPRDGYWERIREICDFYNVLLIADEVMTGIGRCGENFCVDRWGVVPDIIVLAKGLSSGYTPLGAIIVKDFIYHAIISGSGSFLHGHTYGQNPLSTAIGAAVLKYIEKHSLIERAREMGKVFAERLNELNEFDMVGDVRCIGLFAGVEFVANKKTKKTFNPALKVAHQVFDEAFKRGLITYPGTGGADGIRGDHLLLAPPYIITEEQIDEMVGILKDAIAAVENAVM